MAGSLTVTGGAGTTGAAAATCFGGATRGAGVLAADIVSGAWNRDSSFATSASSAPVDAATDLKVGAAARTLSVGGVDGAAAGVVAVLRRRISSHRSPGVDAARTAKSPPIAAGVNSK